VRGARVIAAIFTALLVAAVTFAQDPPAAETTRLPVRAAYVLRGGEPMPLDAEPPHPGEVIGLRIDWPENERVLTELVAPGMQIDQVVPLELKLEDPLTENADVLEILLLGLDEIEIPEILLRSTVDGEIFATAPIKITIEPALAEEDTEPAPPRAQATIGLNPLGLAVWGIAALLLIGLLAAWWIVRRRRAALPRPARIEPEIPADIWARRALEALLASNLLNEGRLKEFHIRLAEISKEYLSRRFQVPLRERTTAECPGELRDAGVEPALCDEVREWLSEIDMVKFAGEWRSSDQLDSSVEALRSMIDRTRPLPAAAEASGERRLA
jgi:hypothetical protein